MKVPKHHPHASLVPQAKGSQSFVIPKRYKRLQCQGMEPRKKNNVDFQKALYLPVFLEHQLLQWHVDLERHMDKRGESTLGLLK